jgi:hypothetical protein
MHGGYGGKAKKASMKDNEEGRQNQKWLMAVI